MQQYARHALVLVAAVSSISHYRAARKGAVPSELVFASGDEFEGAFGVGLSTFQHRHFCFGGNLVAFEAGGFAAALSFFGQAPSPSVGILFGPTAHPSVVGFVGSAIFELFVQYGQNAFIENHQHSATDTAV